MELDEGQPRGRAVEDPGGGDAKATTGWIGAQMLDILRGIHERGYVHRDVKPSNVTLGGNVSSRDDAGTTRTLCLIDMGLRKSLGDVDSPARAPARSGAAPRTRRCSRTPGIFQHEDDAWSFNMLAESTRGRCRGGR